MSRTYLLRMCLAASLAVLASDAGHAGPITFNSALQISPGIAIWREQAVLRRATDDPSAQARDLRVLAVPSVLAYGATRDLAFFGVIPYLDKTLDLSTPGGRVRRGDHGLGDVLALGRYTVYRLDMIGETRRIAPFLGLKFPTGEDDATDRLGRLPQPLQLGSGSWDPLLGVVFTWQTLPWELDSAFEYAIRTSANDFEFGDAAELDLSFQYRVWPLELGRGVPAFVYAVLESNLIWEGKNEVAGRTDPDSGGVTWFLDPGVQLVTERWVLEASVQLPVVQDLNGQALGGDYIVRGGFRYNFDVPYLR